MIPKVQFDTEIQHIITHAIREDIGDGDHSSLACIASSSRGKAQLLVKDQGIIAGVTFATMVFETIDPEIRITLCIHDGQRVTHNDIVFIAEGRSQSILKAERIVLNAMQRMSAIATKTHTFVKLLEGTGTKILDTRKTTPGIRLLEKWAVQLGGGENHRFGLYDMIMLKDNHIDFAGGIDQAITKTKRYLNIHEKYLKIIVEARNLREVSEILRHQGIDRILLDNFTYEDTRKAVAMIDGRCATESSGGIDEQTVKAYANCGVTYISSGALTHSVYNMDLSLKAI